MCRSEKKKKNGRVLTFETMRAPERLTGTDPTTTTTKQKKTLKWMLRRA